MAYTIIFDTRNAYFALKLNSSKKNRGVCFGRKASTEKTN